MAWDTCDVDGFDAELYLRMAGEQLLVDGMSGPWGSELNDAARALLAVGAIDLATARAVCDDYALALSLRGRGAPVGWGGAAAPPPAQGQLPVGPRIVACERAIPQPWGLLTVHYAVLRSDATMLKVSLARDAIQAGKRGGRSTRLGGGALAASGWHPPTISVADDRGTSTMATFTTGGGSDLEWEATYTARPGLVQDAGWIELLGERVVCTERPAHGEVTVEPIPGDPAHRFLWHQVGRSSFRPGEVVDLPAVVDALEACGSLAAGDPDSAAAQSVATALQGTVFPFAPGGPPAGMGGPVGSLPEPWRSMLKGRGRAGGPLGSVVVDVRTPVFDGISAGLMVLDSNESGFSLDVELNGPVAYQRPYTGAIDRVDVNWQATDDRGNHYLGGMGQWHSSDHGSGGAVQFWPALDPKARWLDLAVSTIRTRAVVRVQLAWDRWR